MKIAIMIVLLIVLLLFAGDFSVSVKPFSIKMPYWHRALGLLLLMVSIVVYNVGEHSKGYREGLKRGSEMTLESFRKILGEHKDK